MFLGIVFVKDDFFRHVERYFADILVGDLIMNVDISTKTAKLEELQGKVIEALNEIKVLQQEVDYKTSDLVTRLNGDPEMAGIAIELLLVMAGYKKVPVEGNC